MTTEYTDRSVSRSRPHISGQRGHPLLPLTVERAARLAGHACDTSWVIRIYADFNNRGEKDRSDQVALDCPGSRADLAQEASHVASGQRIILYVPDEFEVEAVLEFDQIWWAQPGWSTVSYV